MKRTTIYITPETEEYISKMAVAKKWSASKTISYLLEFSIKEKSRKKKNDRI